MFLAINQYGDKYILPDKKIKTLLNMVDYTSATPMFRDTKDNKSFKAGYILTHKGYNPLWFDIYELKNAFEVV